MPSPFIESLRENMRLRGYSLRTGKSYLHWIKRYIYFTGRRHPAEVDPSEITRYLTYLAAERHASVDTQKLALNALVYLYNLQQISGQRSGATWLHAPDSAITLSGWTLSQARVKKSKNTGTACAFTQATKADEYAAL